MQFSMAAIAALLLHIGLTLPQGTNPQESEAFIQGYVTSSIEHELGLSRDDFAVTVTGGNVTVWLAQPSAELDARVRELLATLKGIGKVEVKDRADQPPETKVSPQVAPGQTEAVATEPELFLPRSSRLFRPLLADPKEVAFFASWRQYDFEDRSNVSVAAIGIGGTIPVWRNDPDEDHRWQLGIEAGVFSEFDMDDQSNLLNSDYIVGFPLEWRHRDASGRLRLYHQSSHLGDETLVQGNQDIFDLTYESLELMLSYDMFGLRAYGGGEYFLRRSPDNLDQKLLHWGAEARTPNKVFNAFRLAAGVDVKHYQEFEYSPDTSVKAGLVFGDVTNEIHLMLEWFDGHAPHGQFLLEELQYVGIGLYYRF